MMMKDQQNNKRQNIPALFEKSFLLCVAARRKGTGALGLLNSHRHACNKIFS